MKFVHVMSPVILSVVVAGCESKPAVQEHPAAVHTEVEVNRQPGIETPAPPLNTGVDVQVGGGKGVEVNVNPPANTDANPNP